jgi:hypothetical protein
MTFDQPGGDTIERVVPLQHPDYPDMLAVAFRSEAFGTPGGSGVSYVSEMWFCTKFADQWFAVRPKRSSTRRRK